MNTNAQQQTAIDLARLADDGCPHIPDDDGAKAPKKVAFAELLETARLVVRRQPQRSALKQNDSGPISIW